MHTRILLKIKQPLGYKIDNTLNNNQLLLIITKTFEPSYTLINKVEAPYGIFLIFLVFLASFLFQAHKLSMVWSTNF